MIILKLLKLIKVNDFTVTVELGLKHKTSYLIELRENFNDELFKDNLDLCVA